MLRQTGVRCISLPMIPRPSSRSKVHCLERPIFILTYNGPLACRKLITFMNPLCRTTGLILKCNGPLACRKMITFINPLCRTTALIRGYNGPLAGRKLITFINPLCRTTGLILTYYFHKLVEN